MDIGFLYGIIAFCCAIVDFIIQNRSNKAVFNQAIQKPFAKILVFFTCFSICDGIWGLLFSAKFLVNVFLLNLFTYTFHIGAAFSAFMWFGYMLSYMKVELDAGRILTKLRYVIIIFQLCLLFQNLYTNNLFQITEDYTYVTTPYRNYTFYVQFGYFGSICLFSVYKFLEYKSKKEFDKFKNYHLSFIYSLILLIFGIGQMLYPDAPFYSIGFMITTIMIYGFNVTVEHEKYIHELHKKENDELANLVQALSANYQAIYYIDIKTNNYKNYIKNTSYDNKIENYIEKSDDFFKVLPRNVENVVYGPDREFVNNNLKKEKILSELEKNSVYSLSYRLMFDGQPVYHQFKCVKTKVNTNDEKLVAGIFNIDDQMKLQDKINKDLTEAKEKAESASRAKSTFLFNMSHDIRTPMNAIQGFTELIRKNVDDKEKVLDYLNKLQTSNEHLLKLINNILDMSRIENSTVVVSEVPLKIEEGMQKLVTLTQIEANGKKIDISYELKNIRNQYVNVDLLHLNQILINVLNNAIKYTNAGGKVLLSVEQLADPKDGMIPYVFRVIDNGIGISKEYVSRIYDEFSREKSSTKSGIEGSGLGMSIVKRLVDLMDGKISIESELGKGTQVSILFYLKICSEERYLESLNKESKFIFEQIDLTGKRVLIVDDVEFNREIAKEILEAEKMVVELADDGTTALENVKNHESNYYDIILMDIQMPEMDGYEATRQIRSLGAEYKKLPIIAMTANAFEEDKKAAYDAGMTAHLAKPIKVKNLKDTINMILSL